MDSIPEQQSSIVFDDVRRIKHAGLTRSSCRPMSSGFSSASLQASVMAEILAKGENLTGRRAGSEGGRSESRARVSQLGTTGV